MPAPDEQKKLDELLKEQERQAEEQKSRGEEEERKSKRRSRIRSGTRRSASKQSSRRSRRSEKKRKEAELKKKREEEKKRKEAEAKKKQFDAEKIAALLNKMPDKGAPRPSVPLDEQAKSMNKGPVLGAPEGRDSADLGQRACHAGADHPRLRAVEMEPVGAAASGARTWSSSCGCSSMPDGTLSVAPQVTNPQNTPYFLAVSDSAVRAVQACEPYSLPPDKYEAWRDVLMTFASRHVAVVEQSC